MTAGPSTRDLLANRSIALLLGAELLVSGATTALTTTLGWQGYQRTHDPLTLGLIGLAEFVPAVLLAIPAGQLSDRFDRRLVTLGGLAGDGGDGARARARRRERRRPGAAPVRARARARVRAVVRAARLHPAARGGGAADRAAAGRRDERGHLADRERARACRRAGSHSRSRTRRPTSGVPIAVLAASALVMLVPRSLGRAHVGPETRPATLRDAFGGVRLILASRALLGAISLDLAAVLFGGATALLPVFSSDVLHVGARGERAPARRARCGRGRRRSDALRPTRSAAGSARRCSSRSRCTACSPSLFGVSRSFALSLVALAALAGADMFSVLIRSSLQPLLTPPEMRGRVGAVERVFIGGSNELGAFESGVAAASIGAVPAVIVGGLLSIVVAARLGVALPRACVGSTASRTSSSSSCPRTLLD